MLPFTPDVFLALFEQYNRAIWPAHLVAYALCLLAVVAAMKPVAGSDRLVAAVLAIAWLWTAVVYHLLHFATINFVAPGFAVLFVLEGLLLAWTGVARGRLAFRVRRDAASWAGLGLAIFAMLVYPVTAWLAGHGWPRLALVGVAPCPTTIFTLGMLLLIEGRTPVQLAAIPLLWTLIGGSAAWLLDMPEDVALPIAGIGGLAVILWKNRRSRAGPARPSD